MHDDLALALELADIADAVTLPRFRSRDLGVGTKADTTWVTEADTGSEAAVRAALAKARPDHAVLGEEEGLIGNPDARYRWIIDPIDGTSSYVRGLPIWASLIALECEGQIVLGVASAPALGRRWWASRGNGAFADGERIRVSGTDRIEQCHLGHASIASWEQHGRGAQFQALANRVWRSRGVGDFWMHTLVAEGVFDVACEPIVSLWDLAAVQVIVEEAGGTFTNLAGEARADGGSAVSSNGLLHAAVLAALS
ncbi:MAG: inositol monophosphatase family protein [Acidimicrobiia bacterium]